MNSVLLVLIVLVIAAIAFVVYSSSKANGRRSAESLADAKADARRLIERLGGQVLNLTGSDDASKQALADASERYTAASSQIDQATTAKQAALAKESAIEGLYYVRAARTAMGMDPGPELESLTGQRAAGAVTEDRRINFDGREIEASPRPRSAPRTTTRVAGSPDARCPPAGTPSRGGSRPWLPAPGASGRCCCSMRCSPECTESTTAHRVSKNGYGDGYSDGLAAGQDTGSDGGGFDGGDAGGGDWGGTDASGWDGGGDFGGDFGDFGGFLTRSV